MQREEFLRAVLPSAGPYFTVQITNTGATRQFKHEDISQMEHAIASMVNRHHNAFVAIGQFGATRKHKDAKLKRAFYVDIDCKDGGQYPDKQSAVDAIKKAIKSGLPAYSIIVDSGNGFHIYWVLTEDISKAQWKQYATALATACEKLGLKVDTPVTKDEARILRVPDSINYKDPKNPKACSVKAEGKTYSFEEFSKALNPYLTAPSVVPLPTVDNSDLSDGLTIGKKPQASAMLELCPMFKNTLNTGGKGQSEPLWHKIMHTMAFCEDGHDYIHKLSDQHESYSYSATERKFATRLKYKDEAGPITCNTYSGMCAECADCEWKGKIKSPIKLGFGKPNFLPYPWRNGDDGLERMDADDGWEKVMRYKVTDLKAAVLPGEETYINFMLGGTHVDAELSQSFTDNRSLQGLLAKHAVPLDTYELEELKRLMNAWVQQLRVNKEITTMMPQFGWVKEGFHHGGVVYTDTGPSGQSFRTDKQLQDSYTPIGELDVWKDCANHILSQPDREAAHVAIASSFAAPLMKFTSIDGALLALVSPSSGTGKTTALRVAQAVWGNPKAISSLNDTNNAVMYKLGVLNNLPGYWDEVRGKENVKENLDSMFRLGQGAGKGRLTAQIKLRSVSTWNTLLVIGTNESLRDHLSNNIKNSDAGDARLIEIEANTITADNMTDAEARHFYGQLNDNYGQAGAVYGDYLARNKDVIVKKVKAFDAAFSKKYATTGDERFWSAATATLVVGASLANACGLTNFNIPALVKYLTDKFLENRTVKQSKWEAPADRAVNSIGRYLHEKTEYIIRSDCMPTRGKNKSNILMDSMRHPAVIRTGSKDKKLRFILEDYSRWFYEREGAGYTQVLKDLEALGAARIRGSVDVGSVHETGVRQRCLEIPLSSPGFKNLASLLTVDNSDLE